MSRIVYADILNYLDSIAALAQSPFDGEHGHGQWWYVYDGDQPTANYLSYHEFTTGNVRKYNVPIMNTADPLNSNFYLVLTSMQSVAQNKQMPLNGEYITAPPVMTFTLNDGVTQLTGPEIQSRIESWLKNGFPES